MDTVRISTYSLGLIALYLLIHSKFKDRHPYPLIGWTCFFGSIFYGSSFGMFEVCDQFIIEKPKLFAGSMFEFVAHHKYFYTLIFSWKFLHYNATIIHLALNFLINIDLY